MPHTGGGSVGAGLVLLALSVALRAALRRAY
jgi:hypothetical protein